MPFPSLIVLGLTGIWAHHASVFLTGALINFITLSVILELVIMHLRSDSGPAPSWTNFVRAHKLLFVAILMPLISGSNFFELIRGPSFLWQKIAQYNDPSPEVLSLIATTHQQPVSFARIGLNEDLRRMDLLRAYRLSCPDFQQYEFYAQDRLNRIYSCLTTSPYLMISPAISAELFRSNPSEMMAPEGATTPFKEFLRRVRLALQELYHCENPISNGSWVCKRRLPANGAS